MVRRGCTFTFFGHTGVYLRLFRPYGGVGKTRPREPAPTPSNSIPTCWQGVCSWCQPRTYEVHPFFFRVRYWNSRHRRGAGGSTRFLPVDYILGGICLPPAITLLILFIWKTVRKKKVSCEIGNFLKAHLCKPGVDSSIAHAWLVPLLD